MNKDIFIGPFAFHLKADERFTPYLDMESFEEPKEFEYTDYKVEIDSIDNMNFEGNLIHKSNYFDIYQSSGIEHRYYHQNYDGVDHYYLHASLSGKIIRIEFNELAVTFGRAFELWRYLFLEKLLLDYDGFILHSSSILWNGKAILFTAPSGTGKSTQADLWKKYENAEGINGDRNIVIFHKGCWYCCGLPWHGSSSDCKNIIAPICCIAVIRQNQFDHILPFTPVNKIKYLFSEITKNSWDILFIEETLTLIEKLAKNIEIIQLNCTMNQTAVHCLKDYIEVKAWKY